MALEIVPPEQDTDDNVFGASPYEFHQPLDLAMLSGSAAMIEAVEISVFDCSSTSTVGYAAPVAQATTSVQGHPIIR